MTIETKYNIGDEVWFISGSKEKCGYIEYLRTHYECSRWEEDKVESYTVRVFDDILYVVEAERLFPTKEELLKSLSSMKFNSQICTTKEQSERLLALGLKAETADMRYILFEGDLEPCIRAMPWNSICIPCQNNFPAWSLHRLIEIANLPQYWECMSGNWYEEIIATIQSEIHIGEFNKEYLEEVWMKV